MENFEPTGGTFQVVTLQTCLQVEEKLLVLLNRKGSEPNLETQFLSNSSKSLSKCSPCPFEARYQVWKSIDELHCACFLSVLNIKLRQRLCILVHPSCGKRPHVKLSCNLSATLMGNLICASLDTMRRPIRVLFAYVDPCDAENAVVSILFALVLGQLTAEQVMQSRAKSQLNFVTTWCKH